MAQAFDLAAIVNTAGAPFLRALCEGAGTPDADIVQLGRGAVPPSFAPRTPCRLCVKRSPSENPRLQPRSTHCHFDRNPERSDGKRRNLLFLGHGSHETARVGQTLLSVAFDLDVDL
jgi:hypothetical protein